MNRVHKALGDDNFADVVPEPADLDMPKNPREEWNLALQGEPIEVNPMDNDDLHLTDHLRRVEHAEQRGVDPDAVNRMIAHIADHQRQKRQKLMVSALTEKLASQLSQIVPQPAPAGTQQETSRLSGSCEENR